MRRFVILNMLVTLLLMPFAARAESATQTLDKAAAKLRANKSIIASYTIMSGSNKQSGTMTVEGSMFKINSAGMKVWFDGKTQWTYVPADKEVSISEPTAAELQQINPFAVIDSYQKRYNAKALKSTAAGKTVIELTSKNAKSNGGISKAVVTLNSSTLSPEKVVITMSSRSVVTITINSVKGGNALGVASFRPAASDYKGAEVIDLR